MMKALRHLFAALSLLLCSVAASAQTFEVDGLSYIVLSSDDYTVSVAKGSTEPTGEVVIPSTVTYEDIEYRVTEIGDYAFYNCSSLSNPNIGPTSNAKIGQDAFYGTAWYNDHPDGVVYLGNGLYKYIRRDA